MGENWAITFGRASLNAIGINDYDNLQNLNYASAFRRWNIPS
ncbi:MAG: hypothetical protein AAF915_01020 [Cyanobacteria bacterium P01_D01_bin.50]